MITMEKELFSYYSLFECSDNDLIFRQLDKLTNNDKIHYSYDENNETLILTDLELYDSEISKLVKFFEKYDVLPNYDYIDDNSRKDNDDYSDFEEDYE